MKVSLACSVNLGFVKLRGLKSVNVKVKCQQVVPAALIVSLNTEELIVDAFNATYLSTSKIETGNFSQCNLFYSFHVHVNITV